MREHYIAGSQLPSAPRGSPMVATDTTQRPTRPHKPATTPASSRTQAESRLQTECVHPPPHRSARICLRKRSGVSVARRARPWRIRQTCLFPAASNWNPCGPRCAYTIAQPEDRTAESHRPRPQSAVAASDRQASSPISATDPPLPACRKKALPCRRRKHSRPLVAANPGTRRSVLPA